jgi:hypothetical protein
VDAGEVIGDNGALNDHLRCNTAHETQVTASVGSTSHS